VKQFQAAWSELMNEWKWINQQDDDDDDDVASSDDERCMKLIDIEMDNSDDQSLRGGDKKKNKKKNTPHDNKGTYNYDDEYDDLDAFEWRRVM